MKKKTFILILQLFLYSPLIADNLKNVIEWEEVEGAIQYSVQISKDGKVQENKTNNLKYEIQLSEEADYQYRIGAINSLGRTAWSDWNSLKVQKKNSRHII